MFILDTDIYSLIQVRHPKVLSRLSEIPLDQPIMISTITVSEVLRGRVQAVLVADTPENLVKAESRLRDTLEYLNTEYLKLHRVVYFDLSASPIFDNLRRMRGLRSRSHADLLNACLALAHQATLVTRNTKDFQGIPNLKLDNWAD